MLSTQDALKAAKEQQPCRNPEGHDASDLCAQWRAADAAQRASRWAWWQLILSAFGVVGLGVTILFNLEAWRQGRDANEIARDTAKRQLRAYLTANGIGVVNWRQGQKPRFVFQLVNSGQTPAYEARHRVAVFWKDNGDPHDARIYFRKIGAMGPLKDSQTALFPNQVAEVDTSPMKALTAEQVAKLQAGVLTIIFCGVISYRDAFGRRRLSTFKTYLRPDLLRDGAALLSACHRGNNAN